MPLLTAILHTRNDALRIARAVESLRPCDEVLVIDHGSSDETCSVARRFGARVIATKNQNPANEIYLSDSRNDWIFCLQPTETVPEGLEATLLQWKLEEHLAECVFAVPILEEKSEEWVLHPAEPRLVHRAYARWDGWKPLAEKVPRILDGHLTRLWLP